MYYDSTYILEKINSRREEVERISSEEEFIRLLAPKTDDKGSVVAETHIAIEELLMAFSELRLKLAEHMRLEDVLFLFGNGASMYAGSKDTRSFKIDDYKDEYPDIENVIEEVGALSGIEEQLNALITVNAYYHLVKDVDKDRMVAELIDKIKGELIGSFVNSVDYGHLSLHEVFLLKLRTFGCLKRTSIYTPNYDLAFEYSLDMMCTPCQGQH